jgi:hypothetical protein
MLDAVIYMLEFHEFNAASRRAFNQQQVLFDCIKEELQRANPLLHALFAARLRGGADSDESQVEVVITDLTPPWTSAALLKKHLLSDPTAKSRDKFVGILESLFDHSALTQYGDDLRFAFAQVVTKIVYGFSIASMNRVGGSRTSSPSYDALSEMSSNDSGSSLRRVSSSVNVHISAISLDPAEESSTKRPRRSAADTCTSRAASALTINRAPTPTAEQMAEAAAEIAEDAPRIAPSRTARYVTRSSTDGFRTGITTVNGTTYRCRYMIGPRRATQLPAASTTRDTTSSPAPECEYPAPAEDFSMKFCDYHFDPAVFDDPAESEGDTQPWEYLDDWAWEGGRNLAPFPVFTAPLGRPIMLRPPQQFSSLPGVEPGSVLEEHLSVHRAPLIMPNVPRARSLAGGQRQDGGEGDREWDEAKGEQDQDSHRGPLPTPWHSNIAANQGRGVYAANAVPFPDHSVHSLYSRRSAFRPVPPDLRQAHRGAHDGQMPAEESMEGSSVPQESVEVSSVAVPAVETVRGPAESASVPVQDEAVNM